MTIKIEEEVTNKEASDIFAELAKQHLTLLQAARKGLGLNNKRKAKRRSK